MPNVGGLGPIVISTPSTGNPVVTTTPVVTVPNQENVSTGTEKINLTYYSHSNLVDLNKDDHPQYLKRDEANNIFQKKIYISSTPPSNPQEGDLWIQI